MDYTICFVNHDSVILYIQAEGCVCQFCNSIAVHKSHIIHCRWATKDELFDLIVSNINMIVKMLQCMDTT